MIKTKEELLKVIRHYNRYNLPSFSNKTLYLYEFLKNNKYNRFHYDKGNNTMVFQKVSSKEAIDLYNKLNFHKEFLDKL